MLLNKIYRRARLELSKLIFSSKKLKIQSVSLDGFTLIARVNEDVGRIMKINGNYEVAETNFFKSHVNDGDVCFDIGGNVGYFSLLLAGLTKKSKVHCFEPIALNARLIEASAELNKIDNIVVNNCAVGEELGEIDFVVSEDSAYSSMIDTGRSPKQSVNKVPMDTLDNYVSKNNVERIDFVKIDVEGAEGAVLEGAGKVLSNPILKPRFIMIELVDVNLSVFGQNVEKIVEKLLSHGYEANAMNAKGELLPLQKRDLKRHFNFVFSAIQK